MPLWQPDDLVLIGEVLKTHSYLGAVRVAFFMPGLEQVIRCEAFVFIDWNDKPVPYLVNDISWMDEKTAILQFAGVDSEEKGSVLRGRKLRVEAKVLEDKVSVPDSFRFQGFDAYDSGGTMLGPVIDLIENSAQPLLEISHRGKSILVPFHEDLIKKIDKRSKRIVLELPDGLLDI